MKAGKRKELSEVSSKVSKRIRSFLASSGLDKGDMEVGRLKEHPDYLSIIYRDPVTHDRMTTPEGRIFRRCRLLSPEYDSVGKLIKYRTCKNGGQHLYFPDIPKKGNVVDYLKTEPDSPVYVTEGEKKAAKAWKEGIPCIGLAGIWGWLANKQERPNGEKMLNKDFDLIPDLLSRTIITVYDSDATDSDKKADFDNCSNAFECCLRARGVSRYEKIVLPSNGDKKIGLDDYLLTHSASEFEKLVTEQSKVAPLGQFVMSSKKFLSTNFPKINCIIDPWLTDCGLTMIHAAPGVGKTFFLLALSAAITRKKISDEFCGWPIKRGAGVLFVDGEMAPAIMQSRLARVEAGFPNNSASKKHTLYLLSCMDYLRQTGKVLNFSNVECRNEFLRYVTNHPAKVIILDNIVSLMSTKDENDAGAWSVINQWLLNLRAIGKSVIIVHHSSKHGTQRGTSHRSDNLDTILKIERHGENEVKVIFEKHRNFGATEASPIHIKFDIDGDKAVFTRQEGVDFEREDRDREIITMHEAGTPQNEIAAHFHLSPGRVSQIITGMTGEEGEDWL